MNFLNYIKNKLYLIIIKLIMSYDLVDFQKYNNDEVITKECEKINEVEIKLENFDKIIEMEKREYADLLNDYNDYNKDNNSDNKQEVENIQQVLGPSEYMNHVTTL